MIPVLDGQIQFKTWQEELKNGFKDNESLLKFLKIKIQKHQIVSHTFPMRVPLSFAKQMQTGNLDDPLLKQVLISEQELIHLAPYDTDPLEEKQQTPLPGILHKYHGRLLVLPTSACAINCRYCFRKHFPYHSHRISKTHWENILAYIREHTELSEIILSGGDPLMLPDSTLLAKLEQLTSIPHIRRIRLHTRLPIVLPSRITSTLCEWLQSAQKKIILVTHCNHPNELSKEVYQAVKDLRDAHVSLLNQSVLLKGINNCVEILTELSQKLFDFDILPYYLHLPDKVAGTHHFDLTTQESLELFKAMQSKLPGYLVPKLVREEPFASHKTLIPTHESLCSQGL